MAKRLEKLIERLKHSRDPDVISLAIICELLLERLKFLEDYVLSSLTERKEE